jgi:hypothetical protein
MLHQVQATKLATESGETVELVDVGRIWYAREVDL